MLVTPYVGVWIETYLQGLRTVRETVTPYVGVWIETASSKHNAVHNGVTPYVGVWIETGHPHGWETRRLGHSLCGSVD